MAHPRFRKTCHKCGTPGLGWQEGADGHWNLVTRLKSGRTAPHVCPVAGPIGMPPVPGKEYLTEKLRNHIAFLQMEASAGEDHQPEYQQALAEYQANAGAPAQIGQDYDWLQY